MSAHFVGLDLNEIFGRIFDIYIILSDFLQWKIDKIDGLKSSTGTWRTVKYPTQSKRALLHLSKSVFKTMGNSKENFWGHKIHVLLSCNLSVPDTVVHVKNSDKHDTQTRLNIQCLIKAAVRYQYMLTRLFCGIWYRLGEINRRI